MRRFRASSMVPAVMAFSILLAPCFLLNARASAATPAKPRVLVLGDSLAVGLRPYLPAMLAHDTLVWDAVTGRTSPTGLRRLRQDLAVDPTPQAVVVSLGTNDGSDPLRFVSRIRRVLQAIPPQACVVWASINRPPRKGAFAALNRVLYDLASEHPRMSIVDWDGAVTSGKVTLPDLVHPDAAGFHYRAALYARAVKARCMQSGTLAAADGTASGTGGAPAY